MPQQHGTHREFYEREFRGYVKLQGPVPAATRFQPLQASRQATIQEWPQDRGGYAGFLTPPIAFGAVQAVTPKQATRQATIQEWPGYHPPATALGPMPPVSAVRQLLASTAKIPQEQPWHPPPWASGPFPVSRFLPLQSARAQTTQEQPWHPLPGTAAPFPVSAVLPLQAIKAQIVQEQPWHPLPWASAPFPVSAIRPLQGENAQTTQEQPWHPQPLLTATFIPTVVVAAAYVPQPQARTIQEQPWHPPPWTASPFPVSAVRPLQGENAQTTQEQPWHPLPWMAAPFPVSAARPLQAISARVVQEQPWHPAPWASPPFSVSAVLPLQAIKAQIVQEWPWHPLPWVTAALIPSLVPIRMQGRVLFEWPWHPLPWASAPFPVSRTLPLQSVRAQITQEWPGSHPNPWTLGSFVPFIVPGAFMLQPQIRTTQEQPWHPGSWTRAPFPVSRFLPLQSATAQTTQELPWHPTPASWARPPFPVTRFLPLQSVAARITQEWPWHPAAWISGLFQPPVTPLQSASASFTQEWPGWHPLPALPPGYIPKVVTAPFPLPGVSITTLEWPGYHPRPFLLPSYNYVPGPLVFPPRPGYVPAPYGPTAPFSVTDIASAQWVRKAIDVLNNSLKGKLNVGLSFSLNTGVSTTTIIDARISAFSALLLTPLTANAAAIRPSIYVSSQQAGQATLTHSVTANANCGFTLTILG